MAQVGLLEDNARIAKLCATLLQYSGHQVTIYDTPQKCLCALLSDKRIPDGLPLVGVAKPLSSHPQTQALPIILCTAAANSEVAQALQVAPHAGIVEKPFKLQTLVSAISTALELAAR